MRMSTDAVLDSSLNLMIEFSGTGRGMQTSPAGYANRAEKEIRTAGTLALWSMASEPKWRVSR